MLFKRFRSDSTPITVHTEQVDEWTQAITFERPLPYVTYVSRKAMAQSDVLLGLLKCHGYRAVEQDLSLRAMRYVRPLPLWAVHWAVVRSGGCFWRAVRWLYRHGVVRLANDPATCTRLRDIRPWPMKGARMLITVKKAGGKIRYAVEKLIDGKRILVVRKEYEDGTVRDEMTLMPASNRPLFFAPNLAGDLDDITVRDMVQSFYGRKAAQRTKRPDITTLYHEAAEQRYAAVIGRKQFAMGANDGKRD